MFLILKTELSIYVFKKCISAYNNPEIVIHFDYMEKKFLYIFYYVFNNNHESGLYCIVIYFDDISI